MSAAFVAKLSADGSTLVSSTYLGGSGYDYASSLAIDVDGGVYVAGVTGSDDFPVTSGAVQPSNRGDDDGFVAKLNPTGDRIVFATYLGGTFGDRINGLAVGRNGEAVVVGETHSLDFPTVNAFQPSFGGGAADAFVAKLNASGTGLVYSSLLGGSSPPGTGDRANRVALDSDDNAVVVGNTPSPDFPTKNAAQPTRRGGLDIFVTKVTPNGEIMFSTYFGGSGDDFVAGLALGEGGEIYLGGSTYSNDFPLARPFQSSNHGNSEAFVTELDAFGGGPIYSSYLGGSAYDSVFAIALEYDRSLVVGGRTRSLDFPAVDSFQGALAGVSDGFVARVGSTGETLVSSSYLGGNDMRVKSTRSASTVSATSTPPARPRRRTFRPLRAPCRRRDRRSTSS